MDPPVTKAAGAQFQQKASSRSNNDSNSVPVDLVLQKMKEMTDLVQTQQKEIRVSTKGLFARQWDEILNIIF